MMEPFEPLSPAEDQLLAKCSSAERVTLGDGSRPAEATDDTAIRAKLLRAVLLGDLGQLNAKGLRLRGAFIQGTLDLQGVDGIRDITMSHCTLDADINLVNASLRGLHLMACTARGLQADNASFSGSVYLRGETYIHGEVSLSGARIAGDLQICGTEIRAEGQDAVFAPSLRVEGSLFLGNYPYADGDTQLITEGALFFASARVAHDFFVTRTSISPGNGGFENTHFGATEEHGSDIALSLARAQVGGILYLRENQISRGIVNLAGANVERLSDEPVGPGAAYPVRLDGFRYGDFSRHTETSVEARLDWLARRPEGLEFTAQPYEQLAGVLTSLGHRADAQTVLMRKEKFLRVENRRLLAARKGHGPHWAALTIWDPIARISIGYGYRPGRALIFAIALIAGLSAFFSQVWQAGDMAPNAAPILVSESWQRATTAHPANPAAHWSAVGEAGQDYETFNAVAYAADLVVPLVTLGQEDAWAPSTSRGPLGKIAWWLRWVAKTIGWIVTALAAAALTGVIRKE